MELALKHKTGKAIQGSIWCISCKGKCKITYKNYTLRIVTVKCPICKGTGLDTYKGKI